MKYYIVKRIIQLVPIIIGITILSFALMRMTAGDAVDSIYENTGTVASEETKEALREELGLNQPLYIQYINWLGRLLQGDMGTSFITKKPVFSTFLSKLPATILLTTTSMLVTIILSIPLGILAAIKQNRPIDYLIRMMSFLGNAMPGFFLSLVLIYIFSVRLRWLPVMGKEGFVSWIMPTITLATAMSSKYIRQIRAIILEELKKDYVIGARARGVKERVILTSYVLRSSMLTIITLLGLSIGSLLGGTAIIESIFMWDGVGKMAIDAILMRDYPVIQAYVIWMAVIYVIVNLIIDVIYQYLDPRIRLGAEGT